jgi:hypothetical protein
LPIQISILCPQRNKFLKEKRHEILKPFFVQGSVADPDQAKYEDHDSDRQHCNVTNIQ